MSSSQQTTNLGLPIYGDSDVPNWKDTNTPFQTLDDIIGQGGGGSNVVPLLDFDNAIALTSTSITTTKDGCVIGGADGGGSGITVIVNGKSFNHYDNTGRVYFVNIPNIPSGSTIQLSKNNSGNFMWFVPYKYQAVNPVSGSVGQIGGGLPDLDYDNPLHTGDNTTYTATSECYAMAGVCGGTVTLNGTVIARAFVVGNASYSTTSIPLLKLKSGDTIVTQGDARGTYMAIYPTL